MGLCSFFKKSDPAPVTAPPLPGPIVEEPPKLFNEYILKSVDFLYNNYKQLGYDINSAYTHDIPFGQYGLIKGSKSHKTMCVAAIQEIIHEAMNLYAKASNDYSIFDFLPKRSWEGYTVNDVHAHIWVNPDFNSYGTPDALRNFGMGEICRFEDLRPGGFIGFNRADGMGHAVVFLGFIDVDGNVQPEYNDKVAGFKMFSSQGKSPETPSGLDFRYVLFHPRVQPGYDFTTKRMWYPSAILSPNQKYLNCGHMWHPSRWNKSIRPGISRLAAFVGPRTKFDSSYFDSSELV